MGAFTAKPRCFQYRMGSVAPVTFARLMATIHIRGHSHPGCRAPFAVTDAGNRPYCVARATTSSLVVQSRDGGDRRMLLPHDCSVVRHINQQVGSRRKPSFSKPVAPVTILAPAGIEHLLFDLGDRATMHQGLYRCRIKPVADFQGGDA